MHPVTRMALSATAVATGALAYSAGFEVRSFRLRRVTVPVLAPGERPMVVLQISDLHMTPGQRRKQAWVRDLARLKPDLVIDTGDNLAHVDAVPAVLSALEPLLDRPGAFVFGSNDFTSPKFKNPARYLLPDDGGRTHGNPLPWRDLRDGLDQSRMGRPHECPDDRSKWTGEQSSLSGWTTRTSGGTEYDDVAGPASSSADVTIGVTALAVPPDPRPDVSRRNPPDLAGHTHGGQLRIPGYGALVSNCDLDPKLARGLSQHSHLDLPARFRRARHLALRPGAVRLPAGGNAAHLVPPGPEPQIVWGSVQPRLSCTGTIGV